MWFYMNERMNVLISSLRRYNLETLAVSYTGTETLDWMRLFGDAVQSNQVCTFRSVVSCLTWAYRDGLRGVIDLRVHCL